MWPWGHLAFGYVLYSLGVRARTRTPPDGWAVLAVGLGTQFPDLVDKPLGWWFGVLPGGRTLAHSLLFAVPVVVGLYVFATRVGGVSRVTAFAFGYLTHLVGDIVEPLLVGTNRELAFLLWPATPTVVYENEPAALWELPAVTPSPIFLLELGIGLLVVVLWLFDMRYVLTGRTLLGERGRPE